MESTKNWITILKIKYNKLLCKIFKHKYSPMKLDEILTINDFTLHLKKLKCKRCRAKLFPSPAPEHINCKCEISNEKS